MARTEHAVPDGVGAFPRTRLGRRLVRLRVRFRRRALDAALADGCDPWASPELTVRAAQLTTLRERRKVADALELAVRCAEEGRSVSVYLRLREQAVLRERDALVELAVRLRSADPVPAAVVSQLEWLLWNASSPLYTGGDPPAHIGRIAERCLLDTS